MSDQVNDLVAKWEAVRKMGATITVERLCQETPELISEVRARLLEAKQLDAETLTYTMEQAPTIPPSGKHLEPLADEAPAIPGYRMDGILGRGGMGVVYLATDLSLQRQVAIKLGSTQTTSLVLPIHRCELALIVFSFLLSL